MGTTWHLSCAKCNHDFYSGRLRPFLLNGSSWATHNSLSEFDFFFDAGLLVKCLFIIISAMVYLPAPLHFFSILALFILPIVLFLRVDLLLPFRTLMTFLVNIIDKIMDELTLKIHCDNNMKCPKCETVPKKIRSTGCLIM